MLNAFKFLYMILIFVNRLRLKWINDLKSRCGPLTTDLWKWDGISNVGLYLLALMIEYFSKIKGGGITLLYSSECVPCGSRFLLICKDKKGMYFVLQTVEYL